MLKKDRKKINANLSKNEEIVLSLLQKETQPLTAYSILDLLRVQGLRAPLQVYRALEKLINIGKVHRIESMNAFVACNSLECESLDFIAFAICDGCENVLEVRDDSIAFSLAKLEKKSGLKTTRSSIELHGLCKQCESM